MTTRAKKIAPTPRESGLDSRAMLVNLSIGFWEGRKKDKEKTAEVLREEHAGTDAGVWWTKVVPASATKPVINARLRARNIHIHFTLPWQDDGSRVLPATMFMDYTAAMRKAEEDFQEAVAGFLAEYPTHVASARQRLGGLFREDQLPSLREIEGKFPWTIRFNPLPTAGDFRVDLGSDTTKEIQKSIQEQADAAMQNAMGDLWERLHDVVSRVADRLNDPKGIFRDSLIENVVELCELLPKMNVTGDKELDNARAEVLAKLAKVEPEVLRTNPSARADTAKAANDILKAMSAFMPKKEGV